jgi:hypothetical protein
MAFYQQLVLLPKLSQQQSRPLLLLKNNHRPVVKVIYRVHIIIITELFLKNIFFSLDSAAPKPAKKINRLQLLFNNSAGTDKTHDSNMSSSRRMMIPKAINNKASSNSINNSSSTSALVPVVEENVESTTPVALGSSSSLADEFADFFGSSSSTDNIVRSRNTSSSINAVEKTKNTLADEPSSNIADMLLGAFQADSFQADTFEDISTRTISRRSNENSQVSIFHNHNEPSVVEIEASNAFGGIRNRVGQVRRKQATQNREQQKGTFRMDLSILEQLELSTESVLSKNTKKASTKGSSRKRTSSNNASINKVSSSAPRSNRKVKRNQTRASSLLSSSSSSSSSSVPCKVPFSITPGLLDILSGLETSTSRILSSAASGGGTRVSSK